MKQHEVVFGISFKDKEVLKRFRTKVPAETEVEAYDKCIAFAESKINVEIISINETEFIVPEETDHELDPIIQMGKFAEAVKEM